MPFQRGDPPSARTMVDREQVKSHLGRSRGAGRANADFQELPVPHYLSAGVIFLESPRCKSMLHQCQRIRLWRWDLNFHVPRFSHRP